MEVIQNMKYNIFEIIFVLTFFISFSFENFIINGIGVVIMGLCALYIAPRSRRYEEYDECHEEYGSIEENEKYAA